MRKELENLALIEAYLEGKLSPAAQEDFEKNMAEDADFAQEVSLQQALTEAIEHKYLKAELEAIHLSLFPISDNLPAPKAASDIPKPQLLWPWLGAIFIGAALVGLLYWLYPSKNAKTVAPKAKVEEIQASTDISKPTEEIVLPNETSKVTIKTPLKKVKALPISFWGKEEVRQVKIKALVQPNTMTPEQKRLNHLLDLAFPKRQEELLTASITATDMEQTITGEKGISVHIPPNSFRKADGSPLAPQDTVDISLLEVMSPKDLMKYNLPTVMDNGHFMTTGGVAYINATYKGEPLVWNNQLNVAFPIREGEQVYKDMRAFTGTRTSGGAITWANMTQVTQRHNWPNISWVSNTWRLAYESPKPVYTQPLRKFSFQKYYAHPEDEAFNQQINRIDKQFEGTFVASFPFCERLAVLSLDDLFDRPDILYIEGKQEDLVTDMAGINVNDYMQAGAIYATRRAEALQIYLDAALEDKDLQEADLLVAELYKKQWPPNQKMPFKGMFSHFDLFATLNYEGVAPIPQRQKYNSDIVYMSTLRYMLTPQGFMSIFAEKKQEYATRVHQSEGLAHLPPKATNRYMKASLKNKGFIVQRDLHKAIKEGYDVDYDKMTEYQSLAMLNDSRVYLLGQAEPGWLNCDRLWKMVEQQNRTTITTITDTTAAPNYYYTCIFTEDRRFMMSGVGSPKSPAKITVPNEVPMLCLTIGYNDDGDLFLAKQEVQTQTGLEVILNFRRTTAEEIQGIMDGVRFDAGQAQGEVVSQR